MEIMMLTRIFAAMIAALALAAPAAALADDAVAGAIVGAITGAAIATGNVVPYERREPLREYIVRENRPSYHYDEEIVVGRELPPGAYESYEVPEEYVPRGHHYAIPRFIDSPKNRLPWGDFGIRHEA
jgi:hypothetical protein